MNNGFSACELIEMGVRIEENGRAFYEALSGTAPVLEVSETFKGLAVAEDEHRKFFHDLSLKSCNFEPSDIFPEEYFAYLRDLADQYIFTRKDKGEEMARKAGTYEEAIELGIRFEKDSILFYQDMRKMLPEEERRVLDKVIEEEKRHLRTLMDLIEKKGDRI